MIAFFSTLYLAAASFLALYSASQISLLVLYLRHRNKQVPLPKVRHLPKVAVQLPMYNEKFVVEQLLTAVAALDYPRHLLTIQVLDDSTDDTTDLVQRKVAQLRRQGLDIQHVRRENRVGYKAGALAYGITQTDANFFAVFDADFVPPPDFLRRTIPYFIKDERLGIVQTRWGHLNAEANLLTQAQSLAIDAHFVVEQTARNRAGLLLTFNGTGGVWRRQCIDEAGGWSADTLTEDLDLSYRAQIRGWKYLYLPDIVVPGEIPPIITAYKKQQARWAQGTNQCLVKLLPKVWRSDLKLTQKIMATQHLIQYLPHVFILILLMLTPILMLTGEISKMPLESMGLIGIVPPIMHALAQSRLHKYWWARLIYFPVLLVIGTGIMLNNVRAAFKAFKSILTHQHSEFVRTPKFGNGQAGYTLSRDRLIYLEVLAAVYSIFGLVIAVATHPALIPYMALYVVAFSTIALWGLYDQRQCGSYKPKNTAVLPSIDNLLETDEVFDDEDEDAVLEYEPMYEPDTAL